jgi:F-type H+-transporting ATPase subunit b
MMPSRLTIICLTLLLTGIPALAAEEEGGGMISIDPTLLLYQISLFILFVIMMYFLLYKRLGAFMRKRSEAIANDLEEAKKARAEAESFREEYRKRISRVENDVEQIRREGILKANNERENMLKAARAEAEEILSKAMLEIEASRDEAMQQIRGKIADIVAQVVEKILADTISPEREKALAEKLLATVGDQWKK